MQGLRAYEASGGFEVPAWVDEVFIAAVQERMRHLMGHWKATPHGGVMELRWGVA